MDRQAEKLKKQIKENLYYADFVTSVNEEADLDRIVDFILNREREVLEEIQYLVNEYFDENNAMFMDCDCVDSIREIIRKRLGDK